MRMHIEGLERGVANKEICDRFHTLSERTPKNSDETVQGVAKRKFDDFLLGDFA